MPPDEWNYPVNNSAYTNAVAKISLLLPRYAYGLMGQTAPKVYEEVAKLMYMPVDREKNYHPEFDGFTLSKYRRYLYTETFKGSSQYHKHVNPD